MFILKLRPTLLKVCQRCNTLSVLYYLVRELMGENLLLYLVFQSIDYR